MVINQVKESDPRGEQYQWFVSSNGADDAFVTIRCIDVSITTGDDPLGKVVEKMKVPREVLGMLLMTAIYDDFKAEGKSDGGDKADDFPF